MATRQAALSRASSSGSPPETRTPGRRAGRPGEIPLRGWKEVVLRVKREMADDNLQILAAGIAFYLFLALFPALFAAVSIYGLVADPAALEGHLAQLAAVLPPGALDLVREQLGEIVNSSPSTLGWGVVLSILVALWSASKGAKALVGGVNVAYDEQEKRGFFKLQGMALLFTVGFVVFLPLAFGLITVVPGLLDRLPLSAAGILVAFAARWILLLLLILAVLAVVYRFAPSRDAPRWTWLSLGSFIAGGLWLIASILFSYYASHFASFNETYGTIAGAVVTLLWLQISAFVVLLGAELNAELEHQTLVDTTRGAPEPFGRRGAVKADTLPATGR